MGGQYLVPMGDPEPVFDKRFASARTKRRKALKVKPTVRGGPKKRRAVKVEQTNRRTR